MNITVTHAHKLRGGGEEEGNEGKKLKGIKRKLYLDEGSHCYPARRNPANPFSPSKKKKRTVITTCSDSPVLFCQMITC